MTASLTSKTSPWAQPLCAWLDGFTLHAPTRAGGSDDTGREALLRYVLRPPIAQERVEPQKGGLVRIALKRAYADGTVAVDMRPSEPALSIGDGESAGEDIDRGPNF